MRTINLREYKRSEPVTLTVSERDVLVKAIPSVAVHPAPGQRDRYTLTPGSVVGALESEGLSILIRPKLTIGRVLYLASQAMNVVDFRDEPFKFDDAATPVEVVAPAFIAAAQRAFARGLLHGYRTREETLTTVRGRIDFAEQVRRRWDLPLPVEVRYDDFTEDVLANRLVKAAAARLGAQQLEEQRWRHGLGRIGASLANVELVEFPRHDVPVVEFDRLNAHYREVVELSRLILRHTAIDSARGDVQASGFLMDMNMVFQEYLTRALRQALGLSERTFRSDNGDFTIYMDQACKVRVKPDFSWWDAGICVFAGDAKYKSAEDERVRNADLYQALAYATALDLPGALLVYAEGEGETYEIRNSGKRLEVGTVRLGGSIAELQDSVTRLANLILRLRTETPSLSNQRA